MLRLARQLIAKLPANVELDDLVQVGMLGLADALNRFDAARGLQLDTFATPRIRGAMLDELRRTDHVSRYDRASQRTIDAAVRRLAQRKGRAPTEAEIAFELGMELPEFRAYAAAARGVDLVQIEDLGIDEDDADALDRHAADAEADPQAQLQARRARAALADEIERLPARERQLMGMRYLRELEWADIGAVLGMTGSGACYLHGAIVARLRIRLRCH